MTQSVVLKEIHLRDIACFDEFSLSFDPKYNLICGTNGVGKSSLLTSISSCFNGNWMNEVIKRNARSQGPGFIDFVLSVDGKIQNGSGTVSAFSPHEGSHPYGLMNLSPHLIYLNTNRDFVYQRLTSISADQRHDANVAGNMAMRGIQYNDIKNWYAKQWLFALRSEHWSESQRQNFVLATECFSLLDPTVKLDHVTTAAFDIMVSTNYGIIPYEYLSSGFRAALSLLLGIIKELETRDLGITAREFAGIILIDELDMHLHPTWQKTMPDALRKTFPAAQIIVTSHSPHMVQAADAHQVVALVAKPGQHPRKSTLPASEYGFQGWTIEEILEDVMGMENTDSELKSQLFRNFEAALDNEDIAQLKTSLHAIEHMLHPRNNMRKLVRIQAAPVLGADK